ncbi:hypothetical protein CC78DRAFT_168772 [Lojkania enalia]|uniref:Uncharacterized protein n=1 Tax=Lojkania enalia TaxID=147567 RepID=A0A9P4KDZ6_9PLEO|nr:hypothetical protein CC78DRAFT_168772 [Didymosphaeria enalia]
MGQSWPGLDGLRRRWLVISQCPVLSCPTDALPVLLPRFFPRAAAACHPETEPPQTAQSIFIPTTQVRLAPLQQPRCVFLQFQLIHAPPLWCPHSTCCDALLAHEMKSYILIQTGRLLGMARL